MGRREKMKKILSVILILSLAGCTLSHMRAQNVQAPISMTSKIDEQGYTVVDHFQVKKKNLWLIYYFFPISKVELEEMVWDKLVKGDGIVNLKIKTGWTLVDLIVSGLTGMLINPVTVKVEGDVVKFKE